MKYATKNTYLAPEGGKTPLKGEKIISSDLDVRYLILLVQMTKINYQTKMLHKINIKPL